MIRILLQMLIPILTLFVIIRTLFQIFSGKGPNLTKHGTPYPKWKKNEPDVIEICPECGNVQGPRHRCSFKDR
jgi:hypothetical protein